MDEVDQSRYSNVLLGGHGRMLSPTKTPPKGEVVIWNAYVYAGRDLVWTGDLNLTRSEPVLPILAQWLDATVYVFEEFAYRQANYQRPRLTLAAVRVTKAGEVRVLGRWLARDHHGAIHPLGTLVVGHEPEQLGWPS